MRPILYAASAAIERPWRAHIDAMLARWPGPTPPTFSRITPDLLLERLEHFGPEAGGVAPPAGLLQLAPSEAPRTIDRLVEGLLARNLPALVLMDDPSAWRGFQRHGVIFDRRDADPGVHAGALFALAERQSCVELLAREVAIAQRCQGGIRVEIDRIHDELNLAATIQRDLVSAPLPKVPGLDMGVVFRPVNFVSGDIYNVRRFSDAQVGFLIADAVGHGVPAALLTMVLTNALTTQEPGRGVLPPAEVLGRLNGSMCANLADSGRFVTAVYGVLDVQTGRVRMAGAGHPPPLLLGHGEAGTVPAPGPLLGVFPDAQFEEVVVDLKPGQTLMLYTDGLEAAFDTPGHHARRPGNPRTRVESVLRLGDRQAAPSLSGVIDELSRIIDEQWGSLHQNDDITVLALSPSRRADARPLAA